MNKDELRASVYLEHLLQACDRILSYTAGLTKELFLKDQLVQDAVLRNIGILGEATKNLLECWPEIANLHPEVSWVDIYGMRNRITHGYFSVNLDTVWNVVEIHIPALRQHIEPILASVRTSGT